MASSSAPDKSSLVPLADVPSLPVRWDWRAFDELSAAELYAVLVLRAEVFVVEQQCVFVDPDGHDPRGFHLLGWVEPSVDARLACYLRTLPPGVKYREPSIGRVIAASAYRGMGLGRELMREGIRRTRAQFPGVPIRIGAQQHLAVFYASLGFVTDSCPYDEDGIPHIEMLLAPQGL